MRRTRLRITRVATATASTLTSSRCDLGTVSSVSGATKSRRSPITLTPNLPSSLIVLDWRSAHHARSSRESQGVLYGMSWRDVSCSCAYRASVARTFLGTAVRAILRLNRTSATRCSYPADRFSTRATEGAPVLVSPSASSNRRRVSPGCFSEITTHVTRSRPTTSLHRCASKAEFSECQNLKEGSSRLPIFPSAERSSWIHSESVQVPPRMTTSCQNEVTSLSMRRIPMTTRVSFALSALTTS